MILKIIFDILFKGKKLSCYFLSHKRVYNTMSIAKIKIIVFKALYLP